MFIDTLPHIEFADLTLEVHDEALFLYAEAMSGQARRLAELEPSTTAHEKCLDKIARLIILRQVHQERRQELIVDERFVTTSLVVTHCYENERTPQSVS